jgi:hypothetical protein
MCLNIQAIDLAMINSWINIYILLDTKFEDKGLLDDEDDSYIFKDNYDRPSQEEER